MFNVQINDNEYTVYGEQELNIIGTPYQTMIECPSYYDLEIISGKKPIIRFINNTPVITYKQENQDNIFKSDTNADFGLSISIEEYEILYELHLKQLEENPTPEYQNSQKIRQEIETAKQLIKKERK